MVRVPPAVAPSALPFYIFVEATEVRETQMSAYISSQTKKLVEEYAEAHGVKKGFLIEEALLHHLQALRELPADVIVPPRIVVTEQTAKTLLARVRKPRRPTKAMRELFRKRKR